METFEYERWILNVGQTWIFEGQTVDCDRQYNPSKEVHFLIPKTCEYVMLHGKRDFVDVLLVSKKEREWLKVRERLKMLCSWFLRWRKEPLAKVCRWPLEAGKGKGID